MNREHARWRHAARRPAWPVALVGLLAVLVIAPVARAQTLGEVMLVTAIMSELHPVRSLPSGSLRAAGPGAEALIARLPDAASWTDWEVYTATGVAARLEPGLVHNVETELAVAGFWRTSREESTQNDERHVRYLFEGDGRVLLHVIRSGDTLVWLLARGR
jgi:hypothetical protein